MKTFKLRVGDLLTGPRGTGVIFKKTRKYYYYFFEDKECRVSKKKLWLHIDLKKSGVDVFYGGTMARRRKEKKLRTLDLHGVKHTEAEEQIKQFLNFVDLPCEIITGKSARMKKILESVVHEYGWSYNEKSSVNSGSFTITET